MAHPSIPKILSIEISSQTTCSFLPRSFLKSPTLASANPPSQPEVSLQTAARRQRNQDLLRSGVSATGRQDPLPGREENHQSGQSIDIFSLGCLFFNYITRKSPYNHLFATPKKQYYSIYDFTSDVTTNIRSGKKFLKDNGIS
jgi:hypothetical protein